MHNFSVWPSTENIFPVWLQNQLRSAELEPVLIHTEKNPV